jgi:hypothetical protein
MEEPGAGESSPHSDLALSVMSFNGAPDLTIIPVDIMYYNEFYHS